MQSIESNFCYMEMDFNKCICVNILFIMEIGIYAVLKKNFKIRALAMTYHVRISYAAPPKRKMSECKRLEKVKGTITTDMLSGTLRHRSISKYSQEASFSVKIKLDKIVHFY